MKNYAVGNLNRKGNVYFSGNYAVRRAAADLCLQKAPECAAQKLNFADISDIYAFNKIFHRTVLLPPFLKKLARPFEPTFALIATLCPGKTVVVNKQAKRVAGGCSYKIKPGGRLHIAQLAIDKTQNITAKVSGEICRSISDVIRDNNIKKVTCFTYDRRLARLYRRLGFEVREYGKYFYSMSADAATFLKRLSVLNF